MLPLQCELDSVLQSTYRDFSPRHPPDPNHFVIPTLLSVGVIPMPAHSTVESRQNINQRQFTRSRNLDVETVIAGRRAVSQSTATVTSLDVPLPHDKASIVSEIVIVAVESIPRLHHFSTEYLWVCVSHFSLTVSKFDLTVHFRLV